MKIIDINAASGFWPIQPLPYQSVPELEAIFARNNIEEVWLSAVESILFPEPDTYDFALFETIAASPRFRAVKTVNPLLTNWQANCLTAIKRYDIKALKIIPNYHDFPLNHVAVLELCDFAAAHGLPILLPIRLNDERNQPACLQVAPVEIDALIELAHAAIATRFVALNVLMNELTPLAATGNVSADIAFLDDEDPLASAIELFPAARLFFGSHAPFLYVESAAFKLGYSALPTETLQQIASRNALAQSSSESLK